MGSQVSIDQLSLITVSTSPKVRSGTLLTCPVHAASRAWGRRRLFSPHHPPTRAGPEGQTRPPRYRRLGPGRHWGFSEPDDPNASTPGASSVPWLDVGPGHRPAGAVRPTVWRCRDGQTTPSAPQGRGRPPGPSKSFDIRPAPPWPRPWPRRPPRIGVACTSCRRTPRSDPHLLYAPARRVSSLRDAAWFKPGRRRVVSRRDTQPGQEEGVIDSPAIAGGAVDVGHG